MTSTASERRSASVLIVDRSEETRDVLRTILEARGVNILEAKQGAEGLELLREQHPGVVVLDLEVDEGDSAGLRGAFEDESRRHESSLVMLGRVVNANRSEGVDEMRDTRHIIEKPYHYGPLIRTIEQLLQQHEAVASSSIELG
ncbi:MAG: response regulator [Planctomycetota bacterium]|nr:response regulator [Planctomycetota bacterium]